VSRVAKFVRLTPKAEHEAELIDRLQRVRAAARTEVGTDFWTLHSVRGTERTYAMYEIYRDEESNLAHEQLPELVDLLPRLGHLLEAPFELLEMDESD
jgi:quinol monooxygenase YgiN